MATERAAGLLVDGDAPPGGGVGETTYLLHQRFTYDYRGPVRKLRHRLMVVPRGFHGGQRCIEHGLTVTGSPAIASAFSDEFGNHVVDVSAAEVAETISFESWARVRSRGVDGVTTLPPAFVGDARFLAPSRLTRADGVLVDAAAGLLPASLCPAGFEVAERACAWAHRSLTYAYDVTGVRTSAAEAVAGGRGVCQDFAHVMIALCRAAGLPARYVSGHLVGEGGSHAWVEVMVSEATDSGRTVAMAFDPTHDRRAGAGYLTVAIGRDYLDVAPTSGTFEGCGPGVLTASKRLVAADV